MNKSNVLLMVGFASMVLFVISVISEQFSISLGYSIVSLVSFYLVHQIEVKESKAKIEE